MRSFLIVLCAFLASSLFGAVSTNWYVDPNAASSPHNGTSWDNAWTNLADVQWGGTNVASGDTLYISGGSTSKTYTNFNIVIGADGIAGNPIKIRVGQEANHNGKVIFDGSWLGTNYWTNTVVAGVFSNTGLNYITWDGEVNGQTNFLFVNYIAYVWAENAGCDLFTNYWRVNANKCNGIYISACEGIVIKHCIFSNVCNGISLLSDPENTKVGWCWFWIRGDGAIKAGTSVASAGLWDSHLYFSNTIICLYQTNQLCYGSPDGIQAKFGATIFDNEFSMESTGLIVSGQHCDYLQNQDGGYTKVYGNRFKNIGDNCIQFVGSAATEPFAIRDGWFYNNIFLTTETFDTLPQAFRFYDQDGILAYSNILIANNLFVDIMPPNTQRLMIWGEDGGVAGSDNVIANNIFVNSAVNPHYLIQIYTNAISGWTFHNNLFWGSNNLCTLNQIAGTNYYSTDFQEHIDAATVTNLPAFVTYTYRGVDNDFHLASTDTNAINKGYDLSAYFTSDFDGNIRGATWDIGPFEYTAASISSQPASTNIYGGQSATFSVTASGSPPFTYQWKLDGVDIADATNSAFTTNWVRLAANTGVYKVAVSNATDGLESSEATLGVTTFYTNNNCLYQDYSTRAYTAANTNFVVIIWPTNQYRIAVRIGRRNYTNDPASWSTWSWLWGVTNTDTAKFEDDYLDSTISTGIHYEYCVSSLVTNYQCGGTNSGSRWTYDYIGTGSRVPLNDAPDNLILLVESGLASSITSELETLTNDLIGDGYKLFLHTVTAVDVTNAAWATAVTDTKALVMADYNSDPGPDWTIFILGHVPIPYTGNNSPGSHEENLGAHPCDWYYASTNAADWTDSLVDMTNTYEGEAHSSNVPGDGKFDTNYVPRVQMRVGRVDFRDMPIYGLTEAQLIARYLTRDHQWRHKQYTVRDRGSVNGIGRGEEMPGLYASHFGGGDVFDTDWFTNLFTAPENSYLISCSKTWGNYGKFGEEGTNTLIYTLPFYSAYCTVHGSYYGDFDSVMFPNLVFLMPIANDGYCLGVSYRNQIWNNDPLSMNQPVGQEIFEKAMNYWMGSTKWYVDHGTATDTFIYYFEAYRSLQGDPTIKLRIVAPPTNAIATTNGSDIVLTWTASTDTNLQGYHVYRAPSADLNDFTRLTTDPVDAVTYTNTGGTSAAYTYMVRAVKLEQYPTRSFYNASQGIFATTEAGGGEPSTNAVQKASLRGSRIIPRGKVVFH